MTERLGIVTKSIIRAHRNPEIVSRYINEKTPDPNSKDVRRRGWEEKRSLEEVVQALPTWNSLSLLELVEKLELGERVLDYGCGLQGIAINTLQFRYPWVDCHGVTFPTTHRYNKPHRATITHQEGTSYLSEHREAFSVIYAEQSVRYGPDPFLVLKKLYSALKPNGVLLINPISLASMPIVDLQGLPVKAQALLEWWKDKGFIFEHELVESATETYHMDLAIQKKPDKPKLKVPVSLVTIPEIAELKKSPDDRSLGKFAMLGNLIPTVEYVYVFNPTLAPISELLQKTLD